MQCIEVNFGEKIGVTALIWNLDEVTVDSIVAFWRLIVRDHTFHVSPLTTRITKLEKVKLRSVIDDTKILSVIELTLSCITKGVSQSTNLECWIRNLG